ncbi:magnesium protoporphyrin IX methyltransferase [Loktanella sp. SALINAS62]|uniref:magnesium protoporphyrin IX methyltransferase n=1 Tax=Loktanella sp. SALINAS62 TaxID=2706124 RepID=UPI001B8AEC83|nr:magnesium protoporphyrin IX methyltransferase [Loktanella sp. SALINAS62]MBS1302291.1 magnesium protoporphyrin IX methyltransferase [Loktanella sp. SALINAS62]
MAYVQTRDRVEDYFDRSATKVWERLTSDAPVSGIRATVRAGRDQMRDLLLAQLPTDLTGARVLDAGCGTGAAAVALAERGAQVVGVDISPALIDIANRRMPDHVAGRISFVAGDMTAMDGTFDFAVAMDSLIYYTAEEVARILDRAPVTDTFAFTLAPRTPLLMTMFRVGKLFPRADRSPVMIPHRARDIRTALTGGTLEEIDRINSGFYISTAYTFAGTDR